VASRLDQYRLLTKRVTLLEGRKKQSDNENARLRESLALCKNAGTDFDFAAKLQDRRVADLERAVKRSRKTRWIWFGVGLGVGVVTTGLAVGLAGG
jgi:hypothetical protein